MANHESPRSQIDEARLPEGIVAELTDALLRSSSEGSREKAILRVVAANPNWADMIRAWLRTTGDVARTPEEWTGRSVGPYRVVRLLGRGGFGEVYLAEQQGELRRSVALKILKLGMDSREILERFARERQALARMSHDSIARIYDAGTTVAGQPWFAMEHVEGSRITLFCDEHKLPLRNRLDLFARVCHAVHHAHQKGVVHRDLKPGNVLVTAVNGAPAPKLIDFGIAHALEREGEATDLTVEGALLGTPAYMAPEQLRGDRDIDTRADVYALGALLYELTAGRAPHADAMAKSHDPREQRRALLDADAPKPSQEPSRAGDPTAAWRLQLRGDVDWIAQRAMANEPERRYASAAELAADVERHLADEPVLAGPPDARYQLAKFVRRYRAQVVAVSAVLVTAVVGAAIAVSFATLASERADENAKLAEQQRLLARSESNARLAAQEQARIAAELAQSESAAKESAQQQARIAAELAQSESAAKKSAQEQTEIAATKVREFELLKGVVLHRRVVEEQQTLFPAWPERLPAMRKWLDVDLRGVLELRPAIDQAVASLRQHAIAESPEEQARARAAHPLAKELADTEAWLASAERALRIHDGKEQFVEPDPTEQIRGLNLLALKTQAWVRVAPTRKGRVLFGQEALGLCVARMGAVKARGTANESVMFDTLAWALFGNGQFEAAREAMTDALRHSKPKNRLGYAGRARDLLVTVDRAEADAARLRKRRDDLLARIDPAKKPMFPPERTAEAFLHDTLVELRANLDATAANEALRVQRRTAWAESLAAGLANNHPDAPCSWEEARAAIAKADGIVASKLYASAQIALPDEDVHDLVPIGKNPATGLWEFYHLPSAWDGTSDPRHLKIPRHADGSGTIPIDGATGIVFVLLPGALTTMGSQSSDPSAPHYATHRSTESGLQQAQVAPFFLARHELTQGQWLRLVASVREPVNPSMAQPQNKGAAPRDPYALPVENVTQLDSVALLSGQGLRLPDAAEWEHACRAGSTSPWHCERKDLGRHANLADAMAALQFELRESEPWSDGFSGPAAVGSLQPNAFGFFDMHGNVSELTTTRIPGQLPQVEARGGSFGSIADEARASTRLAFEVKRQDFRIGLRAARSLRPLAR